MSETKQGPLPTSLFLGALLLEWAAHAFLPLFTVVPHSLRMLGAVPIVVGIAVMIVADRQFKNVNTAISPFDSPSSLVIRGPFRLSRNPMYLGMVLILVGEAVAFGTLTPFLLPPISIWVFTKRFIVVEEAALHRVFGPTYDDYRDRVRRWL